MELDKILELSKEGEEAYQEGLLEVPSANHETGKIFLLEDVLECFSKPAHLRDTVFLVGGTAIRGKGNDVDIVVRGSDFSDETKESISFRLYRAFADYFKIDYDETPEYLHISFSGPGGSFTDFVSLYNFSITPTNQNERLIHRMSEYEILEKSKRRIIGGIVSTDSIDVEGDRLSREALERIWKHIKSMPDEYLNVMISHSSTQIGKILMKYRNRVSALLPEGLYLISELRDDLDIANDVWKEILAGKLHSFSIKFQIPKPLKKNIQQMCDDDRCWNEIKDGLFIEFSLTDSPANMDADSLEILSKETAS